MSIADLRSALEYIKEHPREWDQTLWFCGTAACLGGHIVLRAGWSVLGGHIAPRAGWSVVGQEDAFSFRVVSPDGEQVDDVDEVASRIVGLSRREGLVLWNSTNTLAQLEEYTARLEADQGIYESMAAFPDSWQHCWTTSDDRVQVAAHRRTSYERIGECVRRLDWDSRAHALDYAETCARGRTLTYHHNYDLRALAEA